jgi:hypothetical protein
VSVRHGGSVSVLDEGPGVAPGEQELIFERFWRGKGAASVGAGLGLAIRQGDHECASRQRHCRRGSEWRHCLHTSFCRPPLGKRLSP